MGIEEFVNKILCGDCREVLRVFPSESVDMIMFSPPYYGLRDYGECAEVVWDGGGDCDHEWVEYVKPKERGSYGKSGWRRPSRDHEAKWHERRSNFCIKCGAWKGELGLEPSWRMYVRHLVEICRELKRVLKRTGSMWIVLGDTYAGSHCGRGDKTLFQNFRRKYVAEVMYDKESPQSLKQDPYKPKCLMGIPWRVAFALIEDGWILRNAVIWYKPNHMPECLSPDTEIYIKQNGRIKIFSLGELYNEGIEGKEILTPFGWRKIKNIWKVTKDEYLTFKAGSCAYIMCSLDHRFPVSHDDRRRNYEIKEAKDLREYPKNFDELLFVPIGKFLDGKCNEILGEKLDYELGKFLGIIVAEGGFNAKRGNQGKITLGRGESELMQFFTNVLKRRFKQHYNLRLKDSYQYCQFSSLKIRRLYETFCKGKCTNKSLNMNLILNTPFEFRKGLFDGIIAGDGYIDKNGRIVFGTASKQLRDDLYLLASSVGLLASRHKVNMRYDKRTKKTYLSYFLSIPLSLQKEVLKGKMLKGGYYDRRTKRYVKPVYIDSFKAKTVKIRDKKVKKGKVELIDIEVEGGLFLINGGIVTHNSVKDRLTQTYEYVFHFVKQPKYYYDLDAIRIPAKTKNTSPNVGRLTKHDIAVGRVGNYNYTDPLHVKAYHPKGKNPGDVFRSKFLKSDVRTASPGARAIRTLIEGKLTTHVKRKIFEVGEYLKQKKRESGLTMRELSELTGIKKTTLEHYFRTDYSGQAIPSREVWERLKPILNLDEYDKFVSEEIKNALPSPHPLGKNPGDFWEITTKPFKGYHYAPYPVDLCILPIKATCPPLVCKKCGRPKEGKPRWMKSCTCKDPDYRPGIVLDPMCGSGSTLVAAKKLGRWYIGIDIVPEYCKMAEERVRKIPAPLDNWI